MDKLVLYNQLENMVLKQAEVVGLTEKELQDYYFPEGKAQLDGEDGILFRLASSLQNSGMMHNSIRFNDRADKKYREVIKDVLHVFNVNESFKCYKDKGWIKIYEDIIGKNIQDNGKKEKKETNWEKYCRGLYDGLAFLSDSNNVNLLKELIEPPILESIDKKIRIIKDISKKIHGLGFALTCDWLKECGCTWLAKPDVHIKIVINQIKNGINDDKIKDDVVIKEIYMWACKINREDVTAYKIDKIIWLLCTGDFYLHNKHIGRDAVINRIKSTE